MAAHKVTFLPAGVTVKYDPDTWETGTHGLPGSVLDVALGGGIEIEHACGGVGVCGTCHVVVTDGMGNLAEADDDEMDHVDMVPGNTLNSRLACRAVVGGDVTVEVPDWNRNAVSESG